MDLAASVQAVTEEIVLRLTRSLASETGAENLCLAGGVALNCVANGKVLRDGMFESIWIQPAAGDAGGALGAALAAYHVLQRPAAQARRPARRHGRRLSRARPSTTTRSQQRLTSGRRAASTVLDDDAADRRDRAGARRRQGGRLVPGPHGVRPARARRPLDPRRSRARPRCRRCSTSRSSTAKSSGRSRRRCCARMSPTGSSSDADSPYMLLVADVSEDRRRADDDGGTGAVRHRQAERAALGHPGGDPRRLFGAHPDRARRDQPALPRAARRPSRRQTGCPVLVNTSFNVRGEPIVARRRTPSAASWAPRSRCWWSAIFICKEDQESGAQARLQERLRARLTRD